MNLFFPFIDSETSIHYDGKWYLFKSDLDHDSAIDFCHEKGAKLFEPKSETVNNKIHQMARDKGFKQYLWLGVHDISNEGHFVYQSDQSPGIFYLCLKILSVVCLHFLFTFFVYS